MGEIGCIGDGRQGKEREVGGLWFEIEESESAVSGALHRLNCFS